MYHRELSSVLCGDLNGKEITKRIYIASTGKSYKNNLATIRAWARKDGQKKSYGRTVEEKNAGYCFNANEDSLDDLF